MKACIQQAGAAHPDLHITQRLLTALHADQLPLILQACEMKLVCAHCRSGVPFCRNYTQETCPCYTATQSMHYTPAVPTAAAVTAIGSSCSLLLQTRPTLMNVTVQPACPPVNTRNQDKGHLLATLLFSLEQVSTVMWQRDRRWTFGQTRCFTWTRSPLVPRGSC